MPTSLQAELDQAVADILTSHHPKKVLLAGAGAGKTFVFKALLDQLPEGDKRQRLVLTFINELKSDLSKSLAAKATVQTFHGYCHYLLRQEKALRGASLTDGFEYFPKLRYLIAADWESIVGSKAPKFAPSLRELKTCPELEFFCRRGQYYDAIGFDDSIVRVFNALQALPALTPTYDVIVVDEVQDFNLAEIKVLKLLAEHSKIVVAGDDDQALYGSLRGASEKHIRDLYADPHWQVFPLPFCMRCPSVIVNIANDIVTTAQSKGLLKGRIPKPYKPFPKDPEDKLFPKVKVVGTSVQGTGGRNYMGRYISQQVAAIPATDIKDSREKGFPTALIIGPKHYLRQVGAQLESDGYKVETRQPSEDPEEPTREDALRLLKKNKESNLGWRIILEHDNQALLVSAVTAAGHDKQLTSVLPSEFVETVLAEVDGWVEPEEKEDESEVEDDSRPRIKLVTFEGSKGLSAHHVFIVGMQNGELPRGAVKDADVCKLIVALTRTRKECHLLHTARFGGKPASPSPFLGWIKPTRRQDINVNKAYWS